MKQKQTTKKNCFKVIVLAMTFCLMITLAPAETFAAIKTSVKPKITKAAVYNENNVKLQWGKAKNAVKYEVHRKKADGKFVLVKTTTKRNYTSKKLSYGTKYTFKVTAITKAGKKNTSKTKTVYTKPAKPVITAKVQNKNQVKITWKKTNGAAKYKVYRKKAGGKFILVKTTTSSSFTNKKLAYDTKYTYKVTAVSKAGKTNASKVKSIRTEIDMQGLRIEMLNQINAEREAVGAAPLKLYSPVNVLAQIKAKDLFETNVFDHYSKNLGYFNDQYDNAGISYDAGGENIAWGAATVSGVMEQWMNSSGHKANILSELYTHVGIGYYKGYWVQQFITNPFDGVDLIEKDSFKCTECGGTVRKSDWIVTSEEGAGYECPSCDCIIWKCMQCEDGYLKTIGICKEDWGIARRCTSCHQDQSDNYVEFCPTCNAPIWGNHIQDNYVVSFRYPSEGKPIWQEYSTSTYACKNCNTYAVADTHDIYDEQYAKLKAVLPEGENIYDYILWREEIGYEDIVDGEKTTIAGMEATPVSRVIYGPDFSWPMETLDDICKYKYKYTPAE